MVEIIKKKLQSLDIHTIDVIKKSWPATLVKTGGMVVGLIVSISLGRLLGAEGLGIINLANRIMGIFLVICMMGMDRVIIKEIAIAKKGEKWSHINNVIYSSYILNGILSILICIIMILISPIIAKEFFHNVKLTFPLVILFIAVTPHILSRIYSSALVGYQKIWQSNLVNRALSTVITGALLLISYIIGVTITVNLTAIFYAIGRISVTIIVGLYWNKLKPNVKRQKKNIFKRLLKTSLPLLMVSSTLIITASIDSIMLGWMQNSTAVGIYNVALTLSTITIFFLQVTVAALSPKIATLYDEGKINELKNMVQQVTLILGLIGFASVIAFVLLGKFLLSLWGEEFVVAYWSLIILSVGQFFNIASGPVGNILVMTGKEKILRNITMASLVLNVILNLFFIKYWGIFGASLTILITIIVKMGYSTYYVKKKFGFWSFGL